MPRKPATPPPAEAARTLSARREHSKGDGNFPSPEPSEQIADEAPRDRVPKDVPKERDPRSAPKLTGSPRGQEERNPSLEARDEHQARKVRPRTGFERAKRAPQEPKGAKRSKRPVARRSAAAKRKAVRTTRRRTAR